MTRFTAEQQDAITREGNLIVSAAAGAGKTAVLTERLCRIVAAGTPVDRLLVLTFTRAAAAEMKARISARLEQAARDADDPGKRAFLHGEARAIGSAHISTIDAFSAHVVARGGHWIGLPGKLRILDDMEAAVLSDDARDQVLTRLASEDDPRLPRLLAAFGGEDAVWDAVLAIARFMDAQPEPEAWLARAVLRYSDASWAEGLLTDALTAFFEELSLHIDALTRVRNTLPPAWSGAIGALDGDILRFRGMLMAKTYDDYRDALDRMEYGRMTFPKDVSEADKKPVRDARDAAKDCIKKQRRLAARSGEEEQRLLLRVGVVLQSLASLVTEYREAFAARKLEKGAMDFADVEHFALEILSDPRVAAEYREQFQYIAVDEYQDSNRVQEALLACVRRPDNLFLVGDVKQSIYRFRQAEPGLFTEKLDSFCGEAGSRIDLNRNFRSSEAVLDAVNDTFAAIMTRAVGEMDYDARARLIPGAAQQAGLCELHVIERGQPEDDDALEDALDAEVEARLVAGRIRRFLLEETVLDRETGRERPYRYADFAVLLRAGAAAETFARELGRAGIPAYAQSSGGYFDALEVQLVLNLLRVIDNRRQDIPLLSVLRASVGGFTTEELIALRLTKRGVPFHEAALAAAEGDTPAGRKMRAFLGRLDGWRRESRLLSVESLLLQIYAETGLYDEASAEIGGAQRRANLDALLRKAQVFEKTGARGIWSFLQHIDRAKKTASVGAAETAAADVVRVLTMHKSKGLEYPVVFLCQLGKRFNFQDLTGRLLLHGDAGVGLRVVDGETGALTDTLARQVLARRLRLEQLAEEMRILYVGMTRARRNLVLVGCATDAARLLADAKTAPTPAETSRAGTPLLWLLSGSRVNKRVLLHARAEFLSDAGEGRALPLPEEDPALTRALQDAFQWEYPFASACGLPAKAAVSRLEAEKRGYTAPVFELPSFVPQPTLSAAARGTSTHAVMQFLPGEPLSPAGVAALCRALSSRGILTAEQADAVDVDAVSRFTRSPLFQRMQNSPRVERELSFQCYVPARRLFATDAEDDVLLQGVIDCCFLEDGAWVLLDYKTDRVEPGVSPAEHAERHRMQLTLYAESLERLTGRTVKERYVVLLSHGAWVLLDRPS